MNSGTEFASEKATRFRYSKVVCDCLQFVIVDIHPDGRAEFWSQEPGEVRWFGFEPAAEERSAALSMWRAGTSSDVRWPLLIP